jgi:hypothetical protein
MTHGDSFHRILPVTYRVPGYHEFLNELRVDLLIERWVTETPKTTSNHEISTVWRRSVISLSRHCLGWPVKAASHRRYHMCQSDPMTRPA